MAFDTRGDRRVAGQRQDSQYHYLPPFPHIAALDETTFDAGSSPNRSSMYGNSTTLEAWIKTVCQAAEVQIEAGPDVFAKRNDLYSSKLHPYNCHYSPVEDDESESSSQMFATDIFRDSPWEPTPPSTILEDSDDTSSLSEPSFDDCKYGQETDGHSQYITIPWDSPWYRSPSPTPSPPPYSSCDAFFGTFPISCSSEVRQVMAQQELLLDIFHEELRRMIPRINDDEDDGNGSCASGEYDTDWLEEVDPEVVLAPMESFLDLCWGSVLQEEKRRSSCEPDVPIGYGEAF
ncbi:hypothetical protein BJ138DRAFT_610626 [Hygrophoropsis aurantiaca]|uniref:Uncharacterized protein n=1 Tax=Hygrophoropsis aurantiaca TaxID=72124 RepID=A0ACB8A0J1_9AGAM|nr:hypothetical protein BJ138DRAFT_610626 [Hygrophoropsis aurantiaca]